MVMSTPRRERKQESLIAEIASLRDRIGQLEAEIHKLTTMRDRTAEVRTLEEHIEKLKLEKGRLTEERERRERETEHKVGLLLQSQEQDLRNARRETELEVREQNLAADKDRFKSEMDFQRKHLETQVKDIQSILAQVLDKLPDIQATFSRRDHAAEAKPAPSRGRHAAGSS
jgi:chromosome segregation ATPase